MIFSYFGNFYSNILKLIEYLEKKSISESFINFLNFRDIIISAMEWYFYSIDALECETRIA